MKSRGISKTGRSGTKQQNISCNTTWNPLSQAWHSQWRSFAHRIKNYSLLWPAPLSRGMTNLLPHINGAHSAYSINFVITASSNYWPSLKCFLGIAHARAIFLNHPQEQSNSAETGSVRFCGGFGCAEVRHTSIRTDKRIDIQGRSKIQAYLHQYINVTLHRSTWMAIKRVLTSGYLLLLSVRL